MLKDYRINIVLLEKDDRYHLLKLPEQRLLKEQVKTNKQIWPVKAITKDTIIEMEFYFNESHGNSSSLGLMSNFKMKWDVKKNTFNISDYYNINDSGGEAGCVAEIDCSNVNMYFNPFSIEPNQKCKYTYED